MKRVVSFLMLLVCLVPINAQPFSMLINDHAFTYSSPLPQNTYHRYCKNIYSQNGEDGILAQLIKELGIIDGTFCEFGASDGITSSNTYNLIKHHNFSGMAIELDQARYQKCVANYALFP